jgi:thioesterase domain-containing protein/acyl carrier protein
MLRAWLQPEAAIQIIYAATEAPMMQWFVDDRCRRDDARIPIGYPLPGNRLALVDEEDRATPPGEVGELIVATRYVSLGRWVEGRFADESVESAGGRGWRVFRTGDLVRQRPDGLLERVGRKDRQVKIRGSRVDLDGIEAMLRGHAFVRDVAAVARPNSADGTMTVVAYVSARDEAPTGLIDELKALMRSAPLPMRPAHFYLVPSIPRLRNSKLDIRALVALDEAHVQTERVESIDATELAPIAGDKISRTVARVWQHVLLVPVRAGQDDFFDSGGDSLKAITFVIELERALGLEISLTLINEAPRFDQLCQALRERRAPRSTPLVTLKEGDGLPPVFFIHGVGGNVVKILPTARRVSYPGAVVGIRARGVVRGEAPHTSIEAMAADYLSEIKKRQPNGPYYVCGYSFGGLVAFEIARRLSESGDEVGLVGLFDTRMSLVRWPLRAWLSIIARRTGLLAAAPSIAIRGPRRAFSARWGGIRGSRRAFSARWGGIRVTASALIASAKYHPGRYRGQLTLFSPAGRDPGLPSLESIWRKHTRTVADVETAGTHATMLSTLHAETTAACLTRCLPAANPVGPDHTRR